HQIRHYFRLPGRTNSHSLMCGCAVPPPNTAHAHAPPLPSLHLPTLPVNKCRLVINANIRWLVGEQSDGGGVLPQPVGSSQATFCDITLGAAAQSETLVERNAGGWYRRLNSPRGGADGTPAGCAGEGLASLARTAAQH